jgi:Protein kinase domain
VDELQPGDPQWVGRYRLLARLGTGGMGRVFLGQSPSGRFVAVKLIRPELADDPGFRRRFAQEVSAARRVSGIFTAPVVDADPDCPQPWLVTAYVAGPSLQDAIEARGPMPVESVLTLAAGLAEGLGAVHAAGVVHRDLKPSNVLLASDGPRIIDFGISRAGDSAWLTNAGGVVGSPGFMSPEQAEGWLVGPPADIFSLGGVLAYAATGEPPFGAGSATALLYRVVYGTAATGHVPARLRRLVERCLAKDPADRPTTDELLADLGYAEASPDWLSWQAAATRLTCEILPTELDRAAAPAALTKPDRALEPVSAAEPGDATEPDATEPDATEPDATEPEPATGPSDGVTVDGNVAVGAIPGSTASRRHLRHARPRWSPRGRRARRRNSVLIGCAVAAVVAAGAALGVVLMVASHHDQDRPGAAASPVSHVHGRSSGALPAAQPLALSVDGPRAVIDSYFAAINHRDWRKVWRLGGQNLHQSYGSMVDGYQQTLRDWVQAVSVVGDQASVVVRARETNGVIQLYQMEFRIQGGVIVHASWQLLATDAPQSG